MTTNRRGRARTPRTIRGGRGGRTFRVSQDAAPIAISFQEPNADAGVTLLASVAPSPKQSTVPAESTAEPEQVEAATEPEQVQHPKKKRGAGKKKKKSAESKK